MAAILNVLGAKKQKKNAKKPPKPKKFNEK